MSAPSFTLPQAANNQQGFYLWVGIDPNNSDTTAAQNTTSAQIIEIAEALGELARELLPSAHTHTTLALGEHEPTKHETRNAAVASANASRYQAPHTERRSSANITRGPRGNGNVEPLKRSAGPAVSPSLPNFDFVFEPRVVIDLHNRRVIADNEIQRLTYKEFELLAHLVNSAGRIISRDELFNAVWRSNAHSDSRTIDVHIRRLREKLGLEHHIITVRGSGYKFELTEAIDVIPPGPKTFHR